MEDSEIIELFNKRCETALVETQKKYGRYCYSIALHILESEEDAEECVSDMLFKVWNAIPPDHPISMLAYVGAITRNLSLDRYRKNRKIKPRELNDLYDELSLHFPSHETPEKQLFQKETQVDINRFLTSLPERERNLFLCRYYYVYPIKEIAARFGLSYNNCKKILSRTVRALRIFLEKE